MPEPLPGSSTRLSRDRLRPRRRRQKPGAAQPHYLRRATRFWRHIDGEQPRIVPYDLRLETYSQRAAIPRREAEGTIIRLGVVPRHHNLAEEIHRGRVRVT